MLVSGFCSAPARTTCCSGIAQPLDDARDVRRLDRLAVTVVDDDDGAPAAAAGALHRLQRDRAVLGRLARPYAELLLERLERLLRADQSARDVRAHLDEMRSHGLEVIHVVE